MSLLPLGHSASSSEVYIEGINKPVTKVYSNRPAWVAPQRTHFMSNFARSSPTLALGATFGVVLMAATGIVNVMGGSRYGGTCPRQPSCVSHAEAHRADGQGRWGHDRDGCPCARASGNVPLRSRWEDGCDRARTGAPSPPDGWIGCADRRPGRRAAPLRERRAG
jgi:hypothetical protein